MANLKIGLNAAVDKNGFIQNYPVGTIIIRANSTIDDGWLLCDGSYANTADYPELYAHLGTTYGALVGSTFKLPPLVYNATHNPTQRMPFSTIVSEASYPASFTHGHTVGINATSFSVSDHVHNHNVNTANSGIQNYSHNHGAVAGTTNTSGNAGGFSNTRAAGPAGPYASANTSATTNHTHGGNPWNANSTNHNETHDHNITTHNQTNYNHNHNTNIGLSSHSVNTSDITPLSKQVYFLIKT